MLQICANVGDAWVVTKGIGLLFPGFGVPVNDCKQWN
jgi:hypothetical protein